MKIIKNKSNNHPLYFNSKQVLLLVTTILFFTNPLLSQTTKNTDFIIYHSGDTLFGKVMHVNTKGVSYSFYKKIRITEVNGKKRRIHRKKIAAFSENNNLYEAFLLVENTRIRNFKLKNTYSIVEKRGKLYFLRCISKSHLSHYHLEWIEQGTSNIQAMDLLLKSGDMYFIRATQGVFGIKNKVLIDYFNSCPKIIQAIQQNSFKSIEDLVLFYNENCVK